MRSELLALLLLASYFAVVWGLRSLLQARWTGSSGWRGLRPGAGAAAWTAGSLTTLGFALGCAAPLAQLAGWTTPLAWLAFPWARQTALVLYAAGFTGTFLSQLAMGRSWRIGLDPTERTQLVTRGPFRLVRHPIYTCLFAATCGLLLLVPNALALAAVVLVWVGLELQVRLVEEPYLKRMHGASFVTWARRTGRFAPGLGKLRG